MQWIKTYTDGVGDTIAKGGATEFSFRTGIETMLNAAAAEFGVQVNVLQEPSRDPQSGAPDFRVSNAGGGVIGYLECKIPGADLRKLTTKAQLERYRALSGNILLTDCWRWLLLRGGKTVGNAELSFRSTNKKKEHHDFAELLRTFIETDAEKIGDAKRLAAALARRCALLREGLEAHADDEPATSKLHGLLAAFQAALDTELGFNKFVDAFAQTLVYSLLLAKLKAPVGSKLDLHGISRYIPANFAVIREVTIFLQTLDTPEYKDLAWVVTDILAVINEMDAAAVSESMSYRGGKGLDDTADPFIYFYEDFLAAYDATLRERRGVYYTPPPVVKFIVRAVDDLLKRDFGLTDGLAETGKVTALDFAAGTGTFMLEMMRTVLNGKSKARRDMLVHEHILKNFHGFELIMAPYVIAHLKLSQFLADNDAPLKNGERINVFLTNTLEPLNKTARIPLLPRLAEEANRAQEIKDSPILVITGNPPYSVASQNKGDWIKNLIEDYKFVDGKPLNERKQTLSDDYVKFIRFAQWKMENVDRGIVAIISNHSFLDNPTFRGMRRSLMNTFDALYFLDLHGNANKKETAPGGGRDENVFDIMQGVAVSILVKNPRAKKKGVFHADLYGKRANKYAACLENDITTVKWRKLKPSTPFSLFIPRDARMAKRYERLLPVTDIFPLFSVGIMTRRDNVAISFDEESIEKTVQDFQTMAEADLRDRYDVPQDSVNWKISNVQRDLKKNKGDVCPIAYRPFDARFTYYTGRSNGFHSRPLTKIMRHMLAGENIGLVTVRQVAEEHFCHTAVVDMPMDSRFTLSNKGTGYLFPLYRHDEEAGEVIRRENFNPKFRRWIDDRYGAAHTPEAILGCIYAILHSPDYRARYADFLRTDFPRIPFPDDNAEFQRLAAIGEQLINAHLLRDHCAGDLARHEGTGDTHRVDKVRYDDKTARLYFNNDEYFAPVPPQVFQFQIGGYQPLDKYLKSRKARALTLAETETLTAAANAIAFTRAKMGEIDP